MRKISRLVRIAGQQLASNPDQIQKGTKVFDPSTETYGTVVHKHWFGEITIEWENGLDDVLSPSELYDYPYEFAS